MEVIANRISQFS